MSPSFLILNIKCLKEHLFKTPRLTDFQYNSSFNKHEQLIKKGMLMYQLYTIKKQDIY